MKTSKGTTGKEAVKTEVESSAIEKIRKLLEFSVENGATESEVENAVKLAQRLMIKHNLDQKNIEITSKDINTTRLVSSWKDGMEARSFESQLLMVLGEAYSCRIITDRNKATNIDSYDVIGLPEDREILVTIYDSILPQVRNLTKKRFKESDKSVSQFKFTTSYQTGFLVGLREKISKDKETFFKAGDRKQFDLIVVQKEALVDGWIQDNLSIRTGKVKNIALDKASFEKGIEDGSEKDLTNN